MWQMRRIYPYTFCAQVEGAEKTTTLFQCEEKDLDELSDVLGVRFRVHTFCDGPNPEISSVRKLYTAQFVPLSKGVAAIVDQLRKVFIPTFDSTTSLVYFLASGLLAGSGSLCDFICNRSESKLVT